MKKKALFLLINIPIWIVILSFTFSIGLYRYFNQPEMWESIPHVISYSFEIIIWLSTSFYLFFAYLVPKYLSNGKNRLFWIQTTLYIIFGGPFLVIILQALNEFIFLENSGFNSYDSATLVFSYVMLIIFTLICAFLGSLFRLAYDSFHHMQQIEELKNQNLLSELNMIKSKLNPHLLFNTLNNIDTLIQTKPLLASSTLSKLSDLLRYTLYDTDNESIPIQEEIENLQKYIDLEKIRLVYPNAVSFSNSIKTSLSLAPMIFLPFVENCFKHSNLNNPNQKIKISISENNGKLLFNCINTISNKKQDSNDNGIGLELAKKRLDLLYPKSHKISIKQENNEFVVSLQIELNT